MTSVDGETAEAHDARQTDQPSPTAPSAVDCDASAPLLAPKDEADETPPPPAAAIAAIDPSSVHRICSGQVILDLATAVKELIENALDASATHVAVTLRAHGCELLEVSDNGGGIDERDYAAVARKHHTSKLRTFGDLAAVTSYGFRGEALSSLAALGCLSLTTKTAAQQLGAALTFDREGALVQQRAVARTTGTTVTLTGLFSTLPVRHKAFLKAAKREYARMLGVVQAYGLMAAGVRLTVSQVGKTGAKSVVFATQGSARLLDAITCVFGSQQAARVQEVDAPLVGDDEQPFTGGGRAAECRLRGWVSCGSDGRSSNDRQYIYINQRPVDLPKLQRLLNDAFRHFASSPNSASYPFLLLDLRLPPDAYDVNVTPNKRTVMLHEEAGLMAAVRRVLVAQWAPSQQTFAVKSLDSYCTAVKREKGRTAAVEDDIPASLPSLEQVDGRAQQWPADRSGDERVALTRPSAGAVEREVRARGSDARGGVMVKREAPDSAQPIAASGLSQSSPAAPRPISASSPHAAAASPLKRQRLSDGSGAPPLQAARLALLGAHRVQAGSKQRGNDGWTITGGLDRSSHTALASSEPSLPVRLDGEELRPARREAEDEGAVHDGAVVEDRPPPPPAPARTASSAVRVDVDAISRYWRAKAAPAASSSPPTPPASATTTTPLHDRLATDASAPPPSDEPTSDLGGHSASSSHLLSPAQLTRVVSKADFAAMRVVGQFNLGFIVARLGRSDLFIVDQHAADEKFRFERLRRCTHIQQQPLLTPLPLHLSPAQSALLADHLPVFAAHGFSFAWSGGGEGEGVVCGLAALPWSKARSFGVADVHELLELLSDGVRAPVLPKLLSVFASRACRSAVMIGDALDDAAMGVIVRHMGEMEHPWACPHGRPTMRHLCDISLIAAAT